MITVKAKDLETGKIIDGTKLFIQYESDEGSASLQTTLNALSKNYELIIEQSK